jgi:hypothetical protein
MLMVGEEKYAVVGYVFGLVDDEISAQCSKLTATTFCYCQQESGTFSDDLNTVTQNTGFDILTQCEDGGGQLL